MALYMLSVKTVSRGQQGASMVRGAAYRSGSRLREYDRELGSVVASAAHLAGERLEDERGGIAHDYRGKAVEHAEVMLPADAPAWMADRERLWNAVEAAEKRCDARLGRELVVALPRELDDARNLELVRGFVRESLVERGIVADFAIHAPTASDGLKQPHAHILVNTRAIDPTSPTGFGRKVREWDRRELVTSLRQEWAEHCNRALELAQVQERVDHRSLAAQLAEALDHGDFDRAAALDRLPGVHLGPAAHAMEREGIATDKGDELRAIREENAERARIYETVREVAAEVPDAPARFMASRAAGADLPDAFEQWGAWAREQLERLHELALAAVERVQEMAVSAWDNLVAAMSPMSDFHMAERAAAEEREAELDRAIDEALAEMDLPEPQTAHENGEQEHEAEPPELGDDDDWLDRLLDEMDHEDAWDRGYEREHDHELEM